VISPRRVKFDYRQQTDPIWTPRRPEFACAANSVSLMMPVIEPYFVRTARRSMPLLPPPLAAATQAYLDQESEHFRQHLIFNRLLTDRYRSLDRVEQTMRSLYRRLERSRSLEFSAAFAAASETMAYSAARWAADNRVELFRHAHEVPATLFLWHLAEEVEHKSVAHEVYRHLATGDGRRLVPSLRYLAAMVTALVLVISFVVWGTTIMVAAERRLHYPIAWWRLTRWSIRFAFELLTNLTMSVLPGFHPSDFTDPLWYTVWLREFDPSTASLPVWNSTHVMLGRSTQEPSGQEPSGRPEQGGSVSGVFAQSGNRADISRVHHP
jgi:predicted metal-dependent hydrolase